MDRPFPLFKHMSTDILVLHSTSIAQSRFFASIGSSLNFYCSCPLFRYFPVPFLEHSYLISRWFKLAVLRLGAPLNCPLEEALYKFSQRMTEYIDQNGFYEAVLHNIRIIKAIHQWARINCPGPISNSAGYSRPYTVNFHLIGLSGS